MPALNMIVGSTFRLYNAIAGGATKLMQIISMVYGTDQSPLNNLCIQKYSKVLSLNRCENHLIFSTYGYEYMIILMS